MAARIAYRQRSLETPKNRLRRLWRRVTAHPQAKVRHAYLVTVNGLELKRVVLPDSRITSQLAAVLERFREDDVLPALVAQYTSELWVEFVEGERIRPGEPGTAAAVARAFAVLYRADARQVPEAETGVHAELCRDLEFLREAGVLDRRLHHRVLAGAERLRPEKIWVGYDYMDAIVP
ncbi:MAG: hypothetical protein MJE66_21615, partial [Proteobacteria bacterium]|nr:hypothetical protein [Pseudomonadota bacterium]